MEFGDYILGIIGLGFKVKGLLGPVPIAYSLGEYGCMLFDNVSSFCGLVFKFMVSRFQAEG